MKNPLKTRLRELTDEELILLNTGLAEAAEAAEAHIAYLEDIPVMDRTYEDEDLCTIEEAYLFLYQVWSEWQQEVITQKQKMH